MVLRFLLPQEPLRGSAVAPLFPAPPGFAGSYPSSWERFLNRCKLEGSCKLSLGCCSLCHNTQPSPICDQDTACQNCSRLGQALGSLPGSFRRAGVGRDSLFPGSSDWGGDLISFDAL